VPNSKVTRVIGGGWSRGVGGGRDESSRPNRRVEQTEHSPVQLSRQIATAAQRPSSLGWVDHACRSQQHPALVGTVHSSSLSSSDR